jgi:rSAM/selenodomain-associated transferase 2
VIYHGQSFKYLEEQIRHKNLMTRSEKHMSPSEPRYSVIIPTLNEADMIEETIRSAKSQRLEIEIIVVDGGSVDRTTTLASKEAWWVVQSPKGRGVQCNVGARLASGDVLLFLHADTVLPTGAFKLLTEYFSNPGIQIGSFRLRFDEPNWLLSTYGFFTRWDSLFTRFGDQCIVIRKSFFEELGGFPDWPILEDVHLLRIARRRTKIPSFPARVKTSSRRFLRMGIVRCQLRNGCLILQYLLGVSPEKLAYQYASEHLLHQSFLRIFGRIVFGAIRNLTLQTKQTAAKGYRFLGRRTDSPAHLKSLQESQSTKIPDLSKALRK